MTRLYPLSRCPGHPELSFSSFLCPSLCPLLSSLGVSRWPNRQICSFSTGLWISYNRPQILSTYTVLPGWEAKQREEGEKEWKKEKLRQRAFELFARGFTCLLLRRTDVRVLEERCVFILYCKTLCVCHWIMFSITHKRFKNWGYNELT